MENRYEYVLERTLTANTLCVVGVCTCLMMKLAVEKVFAELGITDYDIQPANEDNPMGSRSEMPELIFCESLRIDDVRSRAPGSVVIEVKDLSDENSLKDSIIKEFTALGWLRSVE